MKKSILIFLIFEIIILGLTGCGKLENKFDIGNESDIQITKQDVSLSIKDGTLKNTSATLVLINNSDKIYHYGNPYEIEIKQDGKWYKINVEIFFTMPSFSLKPNETKEIELNWENSYGKLAEGTYRIIKGIDYEYEDGKYESFDVTIEFII